MSRIRWLVLGVLCVVVVAAAMCFLSPWLVLLLLLFHPFHPLDDLLILGLASGGAAIVLKRWRRWRRKRK
jgi:hypothetical protein